MTGQIVRILILGSLFLIVYGIVTLKIWDEQIRRGDERRDKISRQSIRKIRFPAVRGRILSSDMRPLAVNEPSVNLTFHLSEMRRPGGMSKTVTGVMDTARKIAAALKRPLEINKDDIITHINTKPGLPMTVFTGLSEKELAVVSEMSGLPGGVDTEAVPLRRYPSGALACHLVGYTGMDDPGSAEDREDYFYYIPDLEGKSGIEKLFDPELRGSPGNCVVRIDHLGYAREKIGAELPAEPGKDIVLTIDSKAQAAAGRMLSGKRGAFALLDADNGDILALVSSPGFNLNTFVPKILKSRWKALTEDPGRPLFNRALSGVYMPGSTVKPLVALAILESGTSKSEEIVCDGATRIGDGAIKCVGWKKGGHGPVDLLGAMEQSCNDYFVEMGIRLGFDRLVPMYVSAGIGAESGTGLPEKGGSLPDRERKKKLQKLAWNEFDTGLVSIGQSMISVTPLRSALIAAAIANGGTVWKPSVLKEIRDSQGNLIRKNEPAAAGHLAASKSNIEIVKEGMRRVVNGPRGSGKAARNSAIELCGKTGSAEFMEGGVKFVNTWFTGFGTRGGKTYAFSILVEKGESGGKTCAPLAARFFAEWLPPSPAAPAAPPAAPATPPPENSPPAEGPSEDAPPQENP
jgi:penicillin-binding protein 2